MRTEDHLAAFGRDGQELVVAGIPLRRLAARVGSTPFFAYDRAAVTARVAQVRAALPDRVTLPDGAEARAFTQGTDWFAVVTDGDEILIYDRATGALRQRVAVEPPQANDTPSR